MVVKTTRMQRLRNLLQEPPIGLAVLLIFFGVGVCVFSWTSAHRYTKADKIAYTRAFNADQQKHGWWHAAVFVVMQHHER